MLPVVWKHLHRFNFEEFSETGRKQFRHTIETEVHTHPTAVCASNFLLIDSKIMIEA